MIGTLVRMLGFDVQRQIIDLKLQALDIADEAAHLVKEQVRMLVLGIAFALAGVIALCAAATVGIIALYRVVEAQYGVMTALGATGGGLLVLSIFLFLFAARRRTPRVRTPYVPSESPVISATAEADLLKASLRTRAAEARASANGFAASAANGFGAVNAAEAVASNLTARALDASEDAVDSAADLIRNGSRTTVFGTLAAAALVGILVARR